MNDEQLYQRLEAYVDGTLTEEQADQLARSLSQDREALARFREKWEFSNLLTNLDDDSDSDEDFSRAFWERVLGEQTVAQFARSFRRRRQETKKTHTPSPAGHGETSDQDGPEAVRHARDQLQWEMNAHKEMIKTLAEESLEKFRAEQRRCAEELAYKQYCADRRRLFVGVGSLAVLLVMVVFLTWPAGLPPETPPAPAPTTSAAPPLVATVTHALNARGNRPDALIVGAELTPGPLQLDTGFVEIKFKNEAAIILEAPAEVNLVNERLVSLSLGTLTAHIHPKVKVFQVETPSVRVTDLGTSFGVVVHKRAVTDVHVLKGCVATSFKGHARNVRDRIETLNANDTMRFDVKAGTAYSIEMDTQQFALSWEDMLYRPHISGPIRFEHTPPAVLFQNAFENDDHVTILLERKGVMLPKDITVDITTPGHYQEFEGLSETIPGGYEVDSYLIHWKPASEIGASKTMSGSVTFKRPILGLIVEEEGLVASNVLFGPSITYLNEAGPGLESSPKGNADTVMLSQDRHTLSCTLKAGAIDQIRVLVLAVASEES